MKNVKILIADDHPFIRDGIRQMLLEQGGFRDIDEAATGTEALEMLAKKSYDLVIMDINMPGMNGIDATREIKMNYPHVKVLAISMFDEQPYIVKMIKAGAKGYVLKNSGKEEMLSAVRMLLEGRTYFSKRVSEIMFSYIIEGKPLYAEPSQLQDIALTRREKEIIRMISEEKTNVEIGHELGISPRTVDTHRRNILQKVKVKNTAGLVKVAMKLGLL